MASLSLAIRASFDGVFTGSQDLTSAVENIAIAKALSLANGTADNQANEFWSDQRTLAATSENHDLYGSLTNALGDTIQFIKVRALMVFNRSTTSGENLTLSGSFLELTPFGGTSPTIDVQPSGVFLLTAPVDGMTVTDSSADTLTINSGAATIVHDIVIVGTT